MFKILNNQKLYQGEEKGKWREVGRGLRELTVYLPFKNRSQYVVSKILRMKKIVVYYLQCGGKYQKYLK